MVEKPGAQNKTACENQGNQRELSDHWKKMIFLKKLTGGNAKKTKRLTEIKSFDKKVYQKSF